MHLRQKSQLNITLEAWESGLLTVVSVAGPGARFLCHGEQGVRDVGQKAIQVKHVGLHWGRLGHLVDLIGPFFQLGLADLTLEHISQ